MGHVHEGASGSKPMRPASSGAGHQRDARRVRPALTAAAGLLSLEHSTMMPGTDSDRSARTGMAGRGTGFAREAQEMKMQEPVWCRNHYCFLRPVAG
jgi:hypothetical protein